MRTPIEARQTRVGLLLAAVRRRQRQAVESRVAELGLSSQKFWVLEALAQQDDCTVTRLLSVLPMDQPTASRVLADLRNRGLVDVATNSDDRRCRQVYLSQTGSRVAQRCVAIAKQIRRASIVGFSEGELADLSVFLERILRNLDDLDEKAPPTLVSSKGKSGAGSRVGLAPAWRAKSSVSRRAGYWRSLRLPG